MSAPVRSGRVALARALHQRALEAHAEAHRLGWREVDQRRVQGAQEALKRGLARVRESELAEVIR